MVQIALSEQAYQVLTEIAAARQSSLEETIMAGIDALEHRPTTSEPMSEDEFAAVLGMSADDILRADAEARRRYPEAFR